MRSFAFLRGLATVVALCFSSWAFAAVLSAPGSAGVRPAASMPASPWKALHDELTRLAVASEISANAKGHVMAVGASFHASTKGKPLTPAEIALEKASRAQILDLISRVQQSEKGVSRQLTGNQTFIARHHFAARIEVRQQATVAQFDQGVTALAAVQQKLLAANSHNNNEAWHKGLEQLQELVAQWQPAQPVVSPKNTPWTTPHLKVRAPHVDQDDYLQSLSMFGIKPIMLAYAGSTPIPPGMVWPVLPTLSDTVLPGDTAASEDAQLTPAIQAQAAALNHNPSQIYRWVYSNISYVPYYGSLQGADFTLKNLRGNDMDIASLLIALFRASNIPARYVYGTIQVPTAKIQNWLGGVPDANAALSLLAQGGVPSQAVTNGSAITAIQLEHVWVEAYVDFVPSRGVVQQISDTWIPLDASFKQYNITAPMNIPAGVPFNVQGLLQQLQGSATINSNGVIQNVSPTAVQAAINGYQQNIQTYLSNYPNTTVNTVLGNDAIQPWPVELLPSVLNYTLTVVAGDFDVLPSTLRWQWRLNLYGSAVDQSNGAPQVTLQGDLPTLLGHRISVGFRPSTSDDSQVLASFMPQPHANGTAVLPGEFPQSVPAYLVNMTAQLFEDGQLVEDAGNTSGSSGVTSTSSTTGFPLGTPLQIESAAYDPSSQGWEEAGADTVNAGETHIVTLDSGMSPGALAAQQATLDALTAQINSGNLAAGSFDSLTGVLLQQMGQNYFGLLDSYEQWMESNQSLIGFRRVSWARIATEVDPEYTQGIIVSATFPGAQVRLDHLESAIVGAGGEAASIPYRNAATERLSIYSQTALQNSLQTILPNGNPVSAVHALATALNQGQALYDLNQATYASLSPNVTLSATEAPAVTNAVAVGQCVLLSPNTVSIGTTGPWTGRGLLYQDPTTGNSRFTVSNGATAQWFDGMGTAWLAFGTPGQILNGSLPAITATRNLNVQLQTALGSNGNLAWTQFTPGNDLINGDLLTQLNAQTQSTTNISSASPNLLPVAAGILATDFALSQAVNVNLDAPPVISSTPPTTGNVNVPYSYAIQASSPQGKTLSYQLASGPSLVSISNTGALSWATPLLGSWPITLRVSDGTTFTTQSWTLAVSQGAPALQVSVNVQPQLGVTPGGTVLVQINTTGGLLPEQVSMTVDGQPFTNLLPATNSNGQASGTLNSSGTQYSSYLAAITASSTVGNHNLVVTVSDGNQTITETNLYAVNDPADTNAPVVAITAPTADGSITSPTQITGTATDSDLAYYQLLISPVGSPVSSATQIGYGTQSVSNGTLGTLDPSTLQNGLYTLSLIVWNSQGQQTGTSIGIEVNKQLKLGQFRLSFNDISITAPGGMPLQLTRTYDSTQSAQNLAFGYGWSVGYQNVTVRKNIPVGQSWTVTTNPQSFLVCLVPGGAHRIVITLPDGSLYNFLASNATQCQTGATPLPSIQFTAQDNTATLTAINDGTPLQQGNALYDSNGDVWDPTQYSLSLRNGTVYTLDATFGIEQIKDKFGNTLTFTANSITSSDGQGLSITRDSSNRITQVTDPTGRSLSYAYDSNGNLSGVTDRLGNTSTFTYLQQTPGNTGITPQDLSTPAVHYLQSYTTPSGVTAVRYAYNASGQLIGATNAQGQSTQISYNTSANQQTVKDKLGNTTVYTYDNNGDVVQKIDAMGNTWNYTFDQNGNQTSQTDPLGHTTSTTYNTDITNPGSYNLLLSSTDALGHTNNNTYDAAGNPATSTDANGNLTTVELFGNGSSLTWGPGDVTFQTTVDNNGNVIISGILGGLSAWANAELNNLPLPPTTTQTTTYTYDSNGFTLSSTDRVGVTTSFTNDSNGNPLSRIFTQSLNIGLPTATTALVTTKKTYDANNNVLTETDALGNTTSYTYDAANNQTSMIDPQSHVTQYVYDADENLIQTIYPDGTTSTSTYDANDNKLGDIDQVGHVTTYVYDALNRLTTTTHPDGSTTTTTYDAAGNNVAALNTRGQGTTNTNDADGRAIATTDANSNTTQYTFDANSNLLQSITPDGQVTSHQYDTRNRLIQSTLPNGKTTSTTYNYDGTKASETDENGNTVSYQYDNASKLTGVILTGPNGAVQTSYGYDEASNKISQSDANKHVTYWQFDIDERVTGRSLVDGRQEIFQYDNLGDVTQHTDFEGGSLYVTYDSTGRPLVRTWPDGREARYTYTPVGKLASVTLGKNSSSSNGFQPTGTTTWTYDVNNRVSNVTYSNGQYISYAYDNVGNLIGRSTADGSWTYGYDPNKNLTSITDSGGQATQYTYDVNNRLSKTIYPDGTTGYREYDVNGRLLQIAWKNGQGNLLNGTVYTLLPNGQRQSLTRFDSQSQLAITSLSYTNPNTGAVSSQEHWALTNIAQQSRYTYDYAGRLIQDQTQDYRKTTQYLTAWTYDNVGNRLTQTKTVTATDANGNPTGPGGTTITTYTYDVTDRLTLSQDTTSTGTSTTTTYSWDQNGRLIQKATPSQITQFSWRADDRLTQVQQGSTSASLHTIATYEYDDNGNRTQRTQYVQDPSSPNGPLVPQVTNYLIDESLRFAETLEETQTTNAGQTTRTLYTWDNSNHVQGALQNSGAPTGPTQNYYEQDGLGNVITLSNHSGVVTERYTYSAFGETFGSSPADTNPYRYTGEYDDSASGLQYNRDRWYDDAVGRFLNMDHHNGVVPIPITLNHYLYALSDPIAIVDPSGKDSLGDIDAGLDVQGILLTQAEPQIGSAYAGDCTCQYNGTKNYDGGTAPEFGSYPWSPRVAKYTCFYQCTGKQGKPFLISAHHVATRSAWGDPNLVFVCPYDDVTYEDIPYAPWIQQSDTKDYFDPRVSFIPELVQKGRQQCGSN